MSRNTEIVDCGGHRAGGQSGRVILVTGTDTGVGKTVLTCLLARCLRQAGRRVAALKPLASGDRADAVALRVAADAGLTLDEVNPWHFHASLTPLLAARREGRRVTRTAVLAQVLELARRFELILVEGAGGLLSPLGENFDARDLVLALRARPVVVCPNRLGALNQCLLVLAALPAASARRAEVVLVEPARPDHAASANAVCLRERLGRERVHRLPWLLPAELAGQRVLRPAVRAMLRRLCGRLAGSAAPVGGARRTLRS